MSQDFGATQRPWNGSTAFSTERRHSAWGGPSGGARNLEVAHGSPAEVPRRTRSPWGEQVSKDLSEK